MRGIPYIFHPCVYPRIYVYVYIGTILLWIGLIETREINEVVNSIGQESEGCLVRLLPLTHSRHQNCDQNNY